MIGLMDIDKTGFPNFALMKISAYYKSIFNDIRWYLPIEHNLYDKIYVSSVFTWSNQSYVYSDMIAGGTGFDIKSVLPSEIEQCEPDYNIYPDMNYGIGFLTRGCIRKCKGCFVPEKEGQLRGYRDIQTIAQGRKNIILMDNNVLASEFGLEQIEKIIEMKLKVDFNQGLDARLIDNEVAKLLGKVKWLTPIRLACDSTGMIPYVRRAVELLRKHKCTPKNYFCYVLVNDIDDAMEIVEFLRNINVDPFAQPYRDSKNSHVPIESKQFARWVNHKAIFKSVPWDDYVIGCSGNFKKGMEIPEPEDGK